MPKFPGCGTTWTEAAQYKKYKIRESELTRASHLVNQDLWSLLVRPALLHFSSMLQKQSSWVTLLQLMFVAVLSVDNTHSAWTGMKNPGK